MTMLRTREDVEKRNAARLERASARRENRVVIPPVFISAYIDRFPNEKADPIFYRFMFPISGTLQHGLAFLDYVAGMQKTITVRAGLVSPSGGSYSDFSLKEGYNRIKPSIPISAGTRLALSFVNYPEKMEVRGIWIGFTFATRGFISQVEDVETLEIPENA